MVVIFSGNSSPAVITHCHVFCANVKLPSLQKLESFAKWSLYSVSSTRSTSLFLSALYISPFSRLLSPLFFSPSLVLSTLSLSLSLSLSLYLSIYLSLAHVRVCTLTFSRLAHCSNYLFFTDCPFHCTCVCCRRLLKWSRLYSCWVGFDGICISTSACGSHRQWQQRRGEFSICDCCMWWWHSTFAPWPPSQPSILIKAGHQYFFVFLFSFPWLRLYVGEKAMNSEFDFTQWLHVLPHDR